MGYTWKPQARIASGAETWTLWVDGQPTDAHISRATGPSAGLTGHANGRELLDAGGRPWPSIVEAMRAVIQHLERHGQQRPAPQNVELQDDAINIEELFFLEATAYAGSTQHVYRLREAPAWHIYEARHKLTGWAGYIGATAGGEIISLKNGRPFNNRRDAMAALAAYYELQAPAQ